MSFTPIDVAITRGGVALAGSPFSVRRYIGRSGPPTDTQLRPNTVTQSPRTVISFDDIAATVRMGDSVLFPDTTQAVITNVRQYDFSLQCDVQIIPNADDGEVITASLIALRGVDITLPDTTTAKAIVKAINITSLPGYIPGVHVNDANADPHVAHVAATDITTPLLEGDTIAWQGESFIVVDTEPISEGATILQWDIYLTRKPTQNAASANSDGTRPQFRPPDIPQV